MDSDDLEKTALVDSIARKMKFLGTYKKYFRKEYFDIKTVEELRTEDSLLESSVRVHSDPMHALVLESIAKKKLDPRWEPFVNGLKAITNKKQKFREKLLMRALIRHVCTSDLLLQYIHSMFVVAQYSDDAMQGMENFHNTLWRFFKEAKLDYLLHRTPMEFNWCEKFTMKALLQWLSAYARSMHNVEHGGEVQSEFLETPFDKYLKLWHMHIKMGMNEKRDKIEIPHKVNKLFGNEDNFNKTSLYEYGKIIFMHFNGTEVK